MKHLFKIDDNKVVLIDLESHDWQLDLYNCLNKHCKDAMDDIEASIHFEIYDNGTDIHVSADNGLIVLEPVELIKL